jgi:hypothetical protein
MTADQWTMIIIISGFFITSGLVWFLQKYRKTPTYESRQDLIHKFLRSEKKIIDSIQNRIKIILGGGWKSVFQTEHLIEILVIGTWAFWVGLPYLDFNPRVIPSGREFNSVIQSHHLWTRFLDCGFCAFWNSTATGGFPAFADPYGSMLHPLVIIPTLIFGVVNGSKLTLILAFWSAGIAQWWIAHELKLGRIPRVWSGLMAVVGGHLVGKMELGLLGIILSTAMSSFVFAAILALVNRAGKRNAVILAITVASALLAGQGYIQLGLAGTAPALLFLIIDQRFNIEPNWKYFGIAITLSLLISAVFLIPFLHFSPNFGKYQDPSFNLAQPIQYLPLNYVIKTLDFYQTGALNKHPYPSNEKGV